MFIAGYTTLSHRTDLGYFSEALSTRDADDIDGIPEARDWRLVVARRAEECSIPEPEDSAPNQPDRLIESRDTQLVMCC
jgi:hypothetical protein